MRVRELEKFWYIIIQRSDGAVRLLHEIVKCWWREDCHRLEITIEEPQIKYLLHCQIKVFQNNKYSRYSQNNKHLRRIYCKPKQSPRDKYFKALVLFIWINLSFWALTSLQFSNLPVHCPLLFKVVSQEDSLSYKIYFKLNWQVSFQTCRSQDVFSCKFSRLPPLNYLHVFVIWSLYDSVQFTAEKVGTLLPDITRLEIL